MLEKYLHGFGSKISDSKISRAEDESSEASSFENNSCDADFIYDSILNIHPANSKYSCKENSPAGQAKCFPQKQIEEFEKIAASTLTEHMQELNFALLKLHGDFEKIKKNVIHLKESTDSENSFGKEVEKNSSRTMSITKALMSDLTKPLSGKIKDESSCQCLSSILTQIERLKNTPCEKCKALECALCDEKPDVQFILDVIKLAKRLIYSIKETLKTTNFNTRSIARDFPLQTIPTLLQVDSDSTIRNEEDSKSESKRHMSKHKNNSTYIEKNVQVLGTSTVKPQNGNVSYFDIPPKAMSVNSNGKNSSEDFKMKNLKNNKLEEIIKLPKTKQESEKVNSEFYDLKTIDFSYHTLEKRNSNDKIDNDRLMHNFNEFQHNTSENESLSHTSISKKHFTLDEAFGMNTLSKDRKSYSTNIEIDDYEKTDQSINLDTELRDRNISLKLSNSKLTGTETDKNKDLMTEGKMCFKYNLKAAEKNITRHTPFFKILENYNKSMK